MRWTPSQIITLAAVISAAISPLASAISTYIKLYYDNKKEDKRINRHMAEKRYQEFSNHFRDLFEQYLTVTTNELTNGKGKYTSTQKDLEAKVLLYADKNLFQAILNLRQEKATHVGGDLTDSIELKNVIHAFNQQWQRQQPK